MARFSRESWIKRVIDNNPRLRQLRDINYFQYIKELQQVLIKVEGEVEERNLQGKNFSPPD